MIQKSLTKEQELLRWSVWGASVLFFFYEFFLRISPSVMVSDLMATFQTTAEELGNLSAFYFYIYAPMQLPVGILMDRFGARRLLPLAILSCGLGGVFFGMAETLTMAELARLLMGFGSAFAFVAMIFIASHWLPSRYLPILIGVGNSFGMLGAFGGEGPLSIAVDSFGWRETAVSMGIFGIVFALIVFFLFRGVRPPEKVRKLRVGTIIHSFQNLKSVCLNWQTWINAFVSLSFYATTTAFAGLWSVPFLKRAHAFSNEEAGFATSMIFLGWIVGGPMTGTFAAHFMRKKYVLMICSLAAFFSLSPVIYLGNMSAVSVFALLFMVGFFSSAQLLTFSKAIELNSSFAKGSATAFTNFLVMLAGAFLQPFVGYLLDATGAPQVIFGVEVYALWQYKIALSCFPISFILAFIFSLFLKRSHVTHPPKV